MIFFNSKNGVPIFSITFYCMDEITVNDTFIDFENVPKLKSLCLTFKHQLDENIINIISCFKDLEQLHLWNQPSENTKNVSRGKHDNRCKEEQKNMGILIRRLHKLRVLTYSSNHIYREKYEQLEDSIISNHIASNENLTVQLIDRYCRRKHFPLIYGLEFKVFKSIYDIDTCPCNKEYWFCES